jgi:ATP phosphoribosyltransferase regulatory subunit
MSLFIDPLVDMGLGIEPARRIFLPLGHDRAAAARLRTEGWTTLAALTENDTRIGCTHILEGDRPVLIP